MITVLFLSPPARVGGGEISLLTLVSNLPRDRYRPVVATYEEGELRGLLLEAGVEAILVPRGPGLIPRLWRLIRRLDADLVHVNTFDLRGGIAARMAGARVVGHLRVIFPFRWPDRLFVRACHRVIAVSDAVRDHFCTDAPGLLGRFVTVYNAVDLPPIPQDAPDLRSELGMDPGTPLVGAVARIDPWKGLDDFVRAAGRIHQEAPETRFVIAGRPGEAEEEIAHERVLRRMVRDLGLDSVLFFLGFRPNGPGLIRQMDLLLVPSLILETRQGVKSEGFGRVVAEALAVGTPVVASRAGGIPEILEDGRYGILVPPGDPAALATAALSLLRDASRREALARAGRDRFRERFTVDRHVREITAVYASLLGG